MSTPTARFQITVPQKDENGALLTEKLYYVTLVADGANCDEGDIQVSLVSSSTELEEGDSVVLPTSGIMPPQDPPTAVTLIAN